jgi:hypothetical protein
VSFGRGLRCCQLLGAPNPYNWTEFAQVLRDAGFQAVPEKARSVGFVMGFDDQGRCVELAHGLKRAAQLVERIGDDIVSTIDTRGAGITTRARDLTATVTISPNWLGRRRTG